MVPHQTATEPYIIYMCLNTDTKVYVCTVSNRTTVASLYMATQSRYPWLRSPGIHGYAVQVSMATQSRYPWLQSLGIYGYAVQVSMATQSRYPWLCSPGIHGYAVQVSMVSTHQFLNEVIGKVRPSPKDTTVGMVTERYKTNTIICITHSRSTMSCDYHMHHYLQP